MKSLLGFIRWIVLRTIHHHWQSMDNVRQRCLSGIKVTMVLKAQMILEKQGFLVGKSDVDLEGMCHARRARIMLRKCMSCWKSTVSANRERWMNLGLESCSDSTE